MDETGIAMTCCRHQSINGAANTKAGESYRIIHFLQYKLWQMGFKYFCYDVVCKYQPFAEDVARYLTEFKQMVEDQVGVLSVFHGRTHQKKCYVSNTFYIYE